MLYSKLFGKTNKTTKEFGSVNALLLEKAGFIDKTMAGVYTFLPLGLRVLNKIENIIREEMDKIGSELVMPSIVPLELWEITGRLETVDVLMKTVPANKYALAKNAAEYVLNSTHEDTITPVAKKFNISYKTFPFAVYQIQTKFRNEPRAKSGLLRCREFRMKDLYSFHTSEQDLKKFYEVAKIAYIKVFERLGLGKDTMIVLASGGDFTKDFSHEFQTRCETGEDMIFLVKSKKLAYNREIAPSKAPKVLYNDREMLPRKDVEGKGIIGVEELAEYLKIPVEKTTKTLLFENEKGEIIAAAVRGGYDINEEKLCKASNSQKLLLASANKVKKITGAEVGYAGLLNLPNEVQVFMDESMDNRLNFEMGANKTHFHSTNINFDRDLPRPGKFYDLKVAKKGDFYPETGEEYEVFKTAEVGNIFPLNTKFTKAFGYTFTDKSGKQQPIFMGSYGIGSSRAMGVIVEKFHDERGIVWPEAVAPFKVHLIGLDLNEKEIKEKVYKVYKVLKEKNIEVLFDDREEIRAGEKFSDADLIGIPVRLVVSKRTGDKIEFKKRNENATTLVSLDQLVKLVQ